MKHSFLIAILAAVLATSTNASTTFTRKKLALTTKKPSTTTLMLEKQLSIRGGAGPIDTEVFAKVLTGYFIFTAGALVLAPDFLIEQYGLPESALTERVRFFIDVTGAGATAPTVAIASMLFAGKSVNTALGLGSAVMILASIKNMMSDRYKGNGPDISDPRALIWLGLNGAATYGALTDQSWAPLLLKIAYGMDGVQGLIGQFAPDAIASAWGVSDMTTLESFQLETNMLWRLSGAITTFALLEGKDALTTLGYVSLAFGLTIFKHLFITKGCSKNGLPNPPFYFNLALCLAYCYTVFA